MEIIGAFGVELGGVSTAYNSMMTKASAQLDAFVRSVTAVSPMLNAFGQKVSVFISAPLALMGYKAKQAWGEQERALISLQGQLGKEINIKPYADFADQMQKQFGLADESVLGLISQMKQFGVPTNELLDTTKAVEGLSLASGRNAMSMYRALIMWKQGDDSLMKRFIPALRSAHTVEEKNAALKEAVARGYLKAQMSLTGYTGALSKYKTAQGEVWESLGKMLVEGLRLEAFYNKMTGFMWNLKTAFDNLAPTTKRWVSILFLFGVAIGPAVYLFNKMLGVVTTVISTLFKLGKVLIMNVLPAVLILGAAFMGISLGQTIANIQVGGETIGSYIESLGIRVIEAWTYMTTSLPLLLELAFSKMDVVLAKHAPILTKTMSDVTGHMIKGALGLKLDYQTLTGDKEGAAKTKKMIEATKMMMAIPIEGPKEQAQRAQYKKVEAALKNELSEAYWATKGSSGEDPGREKRYTDAKEMMAMWESGEKSRTATLAKLRASEPNLQTNAEKTLAAVTAKYEADKESRAFIQQKNQEQLVKDADENNKKAITTPEQFWEQLQGNMSKNWGAITGTFDKVTNRFKSLFTEPTKDGKKDGKGKDAVPPLGHKPDKGDAKQYAAALTYGSTAAYSAMHGGNGADINRQIAGNTKDMYGAQRNSNIALGKILAELEAMTGEGLAQ